MRRIKSRRRWKMNNVSQELKNKILKRDNNTCQKCGFTNSNGEGLEVHHIHPKIFAGDEDDLNLVTLCSICHSHAPDNKKDFLEFISDKIDGKILETFRKSDYSISKRTKLGMAASFKQGLHVTRVPKGYRLTDKKLMVDEQEAEQVREIFKEFLETNISLTQLAKKNNITTSGLKKLLKNTTYLGKVKFAKEETLGEHRAIVDKDLFGKVQEKL
ncbi:MAG: recombinase family protein [Nanoarchaeota archaeon]